MRHYAEDTIVRRLLFVSVQQRLAATGVDRREVIAREKRERIDGQLLIHVIPCHFAESQHKS